MLEELEAAGVVRVIPTARAARLTMDRGHPPPGRRNAGPAHQPYRVLRLAGRTAGRHRRGIGWAPASSSP